jgi:endo-1,4-beta-xylanase
MPLGCFADEGTDAPSEYKIITDDLDDFSKMKSYSKGLQITDIDPKEYAKDESALSVISASEGSEIVYEAPFVIGSFTVYLYGTASNGAKMSFYYSQDGKNYTKDKYIEHRQNGKGRIYTDPEVLKDNKFLKIVFDTGTLDSKQYISKIEIREEPYVNFTGTRIKNTEKSEFDYSSLPSLKEAYKDYFEIGAAAEYFDIQNYPELLKTQFNTIVSENQSRFQGLQGQEGVFSFQWADLIFDFGLENDMSVRLHSLFYYINTPQWVFVQPGGGAVTEEVLRKRYERHIKTVVGHYKGKIKYYDVVNELISGGVYRPYMNEFKTFGLDNDKFEDFIADCFKWAHEADPNARLVFLDNELANKEKRDIIWRGIIPRIIEKGVPKECLILGEQGHWGYNTPIYVEHDEENSIEAMLIDAKELGFPVAITELDLGLSAAAVAADLKSETTTLDRAAREELQAKKYATIFDLLREYSDIIEFVTFWSVTDNTSWRSQTTGGNALLFDYNNEPYPAFFRLFDFEKKEPRWSMDDVVKTVDPNGWTEREIQAVYGTPKIDGKLDEMWNNTEVAEIDRQTVGTKGDGATGTVRCMWDKDNFYAYAEVKDDILNAENNTDYFKDNVEIYISETNHRGEFGLGENQLRYSIDGVKSGKHGGASAEDCFDAAMIKTADGYNIEFAFPMTSVKNAEGNVVGFDAQITDHVDASGERRSIRMFCDNSGNTHFSSEKFGTAKLVYAYVPKDDETSDGGQTGGDKLSFEADGKKGMINIIKSEDGVTVTPLKAFMEFIGGSVRYDADNNSVSASYKDRKVYLKEGSNIIYTSDGSKIEAGAAFDERDGRLYVPLKEIIEGLKIEDVKY